MIEVNFNLNPQAINCFKEPCLGYLAGELLDRIHSFKGLGCSHRRSIHRKKPNEPVCKHKPNDVNFAGIHHNACKKMQEKTLNLTDQQIVTLTLSIFTSSKKQVQEKFCETLTGRLFFELINKVEFPKYTLIYLISISKVDLFFSLYRKLPEDKITEILAEPNVKKVFEENPQYLLKIDILSFISSNLEKVPYQGEIGNVSDPSCKEREREKELKHAFLKPPESVKSEFTKTRFKEEKQNNKPTYELQQLKKYFGYL